MASALLEPVPALDVLAHRGPPVLPHSEDDAKRVATCRKARVVFVLDDDPAHRERAEKYLATLRDDATFAGTPLQTVAIDRLNDLDEIFVTVKFEPRPAPTPVPGELIRMGPTLPPGVVRSRGSCCSTG